MKKIITLILAIMVCAIPLMGCSSDSVVTYTSNNAPWYNGNYYEKVEYDFNRYEYPSSDEDGIIIATGSYVTELKVIKSTDEIHSSIPVSDLSLGSTKYAYTMLTTTITLDYNSESELSGKVDSVESHLLFNTSSLLPVYLSRVESYQSTGYEIDIQTNYVEGENVVTVGDDTVTTSAPSDAYDNDLMFYVMRARSSLVDETTDTFTVFSPKDSYLAGKEVSTEMVFLSTTEFTDEEGDLSYVSIDTDKSFIEDVYHHSLPATDDDGYMVERIAAGVAINDSSVRGSTILVDFAENDFYMLGQNMSNVCLGFSTYEFDPYVNSYEATYANIYTISNYTIIEA